MTTPTYKPQISDLIDMRLIPGDLQALENSIEVFLDGLLKNIQYSDHLVFHAKENDAKLHTLTLHSLPGPTKEIPVDRLPMRFILSNPTGIPCAMEWQWPARRFLPALANGTMKERIHGLIDLLFDFIDLSDPKAVLMDVLAAVFPLPISAGDPDLDEIRDALLANSNMALLAVEVQEMVDAIPDLTDPQLSPGSAALPLIAAYDDLNAAWQAQNLNGDAGIEILLVILRDRLQAMTFNDALADARDTLWQYMGLARWEDFEALLLPYFRFNATDIQIGLEFSEDWLRPVDANGVIIDGERAVLDFTIGDLYYDTRSGFTFNNALQADLNRCMIGHTGLVITLQDVIPDFSRDTSPEPIQKAGYGDDFRGVYVGLAQIEFPSEWFQVEDGVNAMPTAVGNTKDVMALVAEKMVFGSADFSGTISLKAVKAVKEA